MESQLIRLGKNTLIYGCGQFLSKIITFFLLPLTTAFLTPEDYGTIAMIGNIGIFLAGFYTLGFGVSLGRCYWSTENLLEKHGIIWTAFLALFFNSLLLSSIGIFFSADISHFLLGNSSYSHLIILTFVSLIFSNAVLPFASYIRIEEKAYLAAFISLLEVITSIGLTIYFVVYQRKGPEGIVLANLFSQGLALTILFMMCLASLKFSFQWRFLPEMLRVGYPYIFGLFGLYLLPTITRFSLQSFTDTATVGLFFMGANFAQIVALLVAAFISAWPPFFSSYINKQEEALDLFGKIMTYYLITMGIVIGLFFLFAKLAAHIMMQPSFHGVWTVIGVLACAQACYGVYSISAAGFIFFKKSSWQMALEVGTGLISILFNFLFIPFLHKEGAALATLFSYLFLVSISLWINLKLLPVRYEWEKIVKIFVALFILGSASFIPIENVYTYTSFMLTIFLCYVSYLWTYVVSTTEKRQLLNLLGIFPYWSNKPL